jgi:hypothetical protein
MNNQIEKIYDIRNKDGYEKVKIIIYYGLDKEKLLSHPVSFNDEMAELLFMFIPISEDFSWFEKNTNKSPYVSVLKWTGDENNTSMDIFEKIVNNLILKQNEALEYLFNKKEED